MNDTQPLPGSERRAALIGGRGHAVRGQGSSLLVVVLGFTASGRNGVLVAEVSRLAGPAGAGSPTRAGLVFGYAGLTVAPTAFAAASSAASMALAVTAIVAASGVAGAVLWRTTRDPEAAVAGSDGAAEPPQR